MALAADDVNALTLGRLAAAPFACALSTVERCELSSMVLQVGDWPFFAPWRAV